MKNAYEHHRQEIIDGKELDWNKIDFTLANDYGWTLAHTSAGYTKLPKDFPHWAVRNNDGLPAVCVAVLWDTLPDDFDQWDIMYKDMTIAHYAINNNKSLTHFEDWDLKDSNGMSVAEALIRKSIKLPDSFDMWDIETKDGSTIGHMYAKMFNHDPDSKVWTMKDSKGESVAAVACRFNTISLDKRFKYWNMRDSYHNKTIKAIYLGN